MSKKTEKPRKSEKNNRKNRTVKKTMKILKKPTGSVRFRFYKPKTKKPNRTQTEKKPSQIGKNRAKPV
jgi:ribonuclease PH